MFNFNSLEMKKNLIPIILFECSCPKATALTDVPTQDCPIDFSQIQRYGFQRGGNSFDTSAGTPTDITLLADWQTLRTAIDDTKIVVSPLIGADPIITPGDPISNGGGDNSTLNGVEEITGTNPSSASATFNSLSPEIEKAMKALICEPDLTVYLFLKGGKIVAKKIVADQQYSGLPIQSFFFGDRGNEGFGTKDTNFMSFQLPAGWSEDIEVFDAVDLDFNPLTDL